MRYLNWLLRAFVFFILLGLAVKNDQPATLRYFMGYEWHTSLVVILLLFFIIGAVVGMLAVMGKILRQRREIAKLKRELRLKNKLADAAETPPIQPS